MENFIIGVLSSVTAVIIIYCFKGMLSKAYFYIFKRLYPNISGKYEIVYGDEDRQKQWYDGEKGILVISQYGKSIKGQYKIFSGSICKIKFLINGFVTPDRIGVISYYDDKNKTKGAGSFVISLIGLQENYNGKMVYICSLCDKIHQFPVELKKIESADD